MYWKKSSQVFCRDTKAHTEIISSVIITTNIKLVLQLWIVRPWRSSCLKVTTHSYFIFQYVWRLRLVMIIYDHTFFQYINYTQMLFAIRVWNPLADNPSSMRLYHPCSSSSGRALSFYHYLHPLHGKYISVHQYFFKGHTDTYISLCLYNRHTRCT